MSQCAITAPIFAPYVHVTFSSSLSVKMQYSFHESRMCLSKPLARKDKLTGSYFSQFMCALANS